jgi:hypothetical protein
MELPGDIGAGFREELYAGGGCCCWLNTWRHEPLVNRIPVKEMYSIRLDPLFQVFLHCLGRQWISGDALSLTVGAFVGELIKRGDFSEGEAKALGQNVLHYLRGERTSSVDNFIGGFEQHETDNPL